MGFNQENYRRIREEYRTKAQAAEAEADARRQEIYREIPEVRELDRKVSDVGLRLFGAAMEGKNTEEFIARMKAENERVRGERCAVLRKNGFPEDYDRVRYECELCRDSGYVGIRMCSCMRKKIIAAGFASSGLAGLLQKQTFQSFSLDYYRDDPKSFRMMECNLAKLKSYAEHFTLGSETAEPSPSLLFCGSTGLGKTHLSTAVAGVVLEKGFDVFYNSAVGMLSDFEARRFGNGMTQDSDGDNTARYTECDLLIIDDLGTEVVNQFTLSCLYYVVNTRINQRKPTVISTNLSAQELRKTYTDRLGSRLMCEYEILPFFGTDVRKQKIGK